MNKASERYNTKVEIPISVILETIFSDDNKDVETLCRWAKHYGYVDYIKENGNKLGYYKLQDDYTKQSFYVLLDKEERKQYDYENHLLDEIDRLNNIIDKAKIAINIYQEETGRLSYQNIKIIRGILKQDEFYIKILDDYLEELKEGK